VVFRNGTDTRESKRLPNDLEGENQSTKPRSRSRSASRDRKEGRKDGMDDYVSEGRDACLPRRRGARTGAQLPSKPAAASPVFPMR
jgi:hypothetical protein